MPPIDPILHQSLSDVLGIAADDQDILEELQEDIEFRDLSAGDVLIEEGAPSDALFVLLRGRLYASRAGDEGEMFLGEIRRGETIGETGIVMEAPRGATVRATRTSTVARLGTDTVKQLISRHPSLGLAIARTLIERFKRDIGPRHPGFVPETLCLQQCSPSVDLDQVADRLLDAIAAPIRIVQPGADLSAARAEIHDAERAGARVLILARQDDDAWLEMAVSEADEVIRIVDARDQTDPAASEVAIERSANAVLPRHTLLLVHPDDTRCPTGTRHWLAPRNVDRHLHMRLGNEEDCGRVGRLLSGRAVGIALAGGGARGAAHLGAIRALNEKGIRFDIVGGTSIGAAIAAWYAMGLRGEELTASACKVFVDSGGPTSDFNLLPLLSLVKGRRTKGLANQAILEAAGSDVDIEDTWTPFFCISANYTAQTQVVMTHGPMSKSLTASYAIPGVLPPVVFDGELYVDGGVMNNLPVDILEDVGAAYTIAIDLLPDSRRPLDLKEMPSNAAFILDRFRPRKRRKYRVPGVLSMLLNSTVVSSLSRQREMVARAHLGMRPNLQRVGLLDWKKFPKTIEQGYASIHAQLEATPKEVLEPLIVSEPDA